MRKYRTKEKLLSSQHIKSLVIKFKDFLIHSSADGHLGCFHVLAIINSAMTHLPEYWK